MQQRRELLYEGGVGSASETAATRDHDGSVVEGDRVGLWGVPRDDAGAIRSSGIRRGEIDELGVALTVKGLSHAGLRADDEQPRTSRRETASHERLTTEHGVQGEKSFVTFLETHHVGEHGAIE